MNLRESGILVVAGALLSFAGFSTDASAAQILAVDFDSTVPGPSLSPTEAGFSSVSSTPTTIGAYTVTVSGQDGFYDRGAPSTPSVPDDLYRDFVYVNNLPNGNQSQTSPIDIAIAGLTPNTSYSVTLYSWDLGPNGVVGPADTTELTTFEPKPGSNTSGTTGTVTWTAHSSGLDPWPTSLGQYATTISLTSTTGTLDIRSFAQAQSGGGTIESLLRVNGFSVSVATPEPSSLYLLVVGGLLLASRRRVLAFSAVRRGLSSKIPAGALCDSASRCD